MSGLSAPRIVFGVHSLSPYSRVDRTPYGILKVIGSASLALTSGVDQLYGGAQRFAWAAETKTVSSDLTAKVKAYPGFLFALWLGATVTENAAETGGSVTALTNVKGTSLKAAVTGVASVAIHAVTGAANTKFGQYVVKAASATTVDVYLLSDVDIARGTADAYITALPDTLKIASGLTVTTGATATAIGNTGIDLIGGSGTIGMTTGDTASFRVRPINTDSMDIIVGESTSSFPAFGALILAQKRANGEMFEIDAYNCVPYGMPIGLTEMAFSETELKLALVYDSVQDGIAGIRTVQPSSFV